jgi:hypothetical protein
MAFIILIFMKLIITQYGYVNSCRTKLHPHWTKNLENVENVSLEVKHDCLSADIHEIRASWTTFCEQLLYRIS